MDVSKAQIVQEIVQEVEYLLVEDKVAQAAALLFDINKLQKSIWFDLKFSLLVSASGHRELFLMASIIGVAEKDFLSQSYHLVPGLYALKETNS